MTTLLTRMFRDRCTRCQVGQGRNCTCHRPKPRRWTFSTSELIVLISLASVSASVGTGWLFARALKAWGVIS